VDAFVSATLRLLRMNIIKYFLDRIEALSRRKSNHTLKKPFCVMPWSNIATETNGKCKICCIVMTNKYIKTDSGEDARIQTHSLNEIWNSKYVRSIRLKMLSGEWPDDCFYCKRQEVKKISSPRLEYNKMWMSDNITSRVEESIHNEGWVTDPPSSLEPRPGISCNLKCTMCWSMSSSSILKERTEALDSNSASTYLKDVWTSEVLDAKNSDFSWGNQPQYIENFEKCALHLRRLYFTGGEPFLLKSNFDRLQYLIDIGHTNLVVSLTTNLTIWNQKYIDILAHFKKLELTVSMDAYGDINSYVRRPCEWKDVEKNFLRYIKEYPQFYPSIICTVQNVTVFGVLKLIRWLSDLSLEKPINLIITEVQGPECMQPCVLPSHLKTQFSELAESMMTDESIIHMYREKIPTLIQWVNTPCDKYNLRANELREFVKFYDTNSNLKLNDIFPELYTELFLV
jgi:sulfatase maturation enzyme AslB (radical SAM superfamily)